MREIVLDTETTGLSPLQGDRIVEIGCVELINHVTTGKTYHVYLNPGREMSDEVVQVHGLTNDFLSDKPQFAEVVDGFLDFIGSDPLVIHNASFDMGFLNAELVRLGFPQLDKNRAIDTLDMARKKYFGAPASLDALCKRFNIDTSARTFHGALLDSQLLAEVYLELRGGRQTNLSIDIESELKATEKARIEQREFRKPRVFNVPPEDTAAHEAFLATIKNPLWNKA